MSSLSPACLTSAPLGRSAEEKIRIVVSSLRGEESIAALCRREGMTANPFVMLVWDSA